LPSWQSRAATRDRNSKWPRSRKVSKKFLTWQSDMILEGVVTNVTNIRRIRGHRRTPGRPGPRLGPGRALREGSAQRREGRRQVVKVKVMEVDLPRKRIALTMRMGDQPQGGSKPAGDRRDAPRSNARPTASKPSREPAMAGSLASAFAKALKK
jgi:uncharacterized protein